GFSTYPPGTVTGAYPPSGSTMPRDTNMSSMPSSPLGGRVVPGATPMPRPAQPRDTAGFSRTQSAPTRPTPLPPATLPPPTLPPRTDTSHIRVDSVKRGAPQRDTIRPPVPRPQQQGRAR